MAEALNVLGETQEYLLCMQKKYCAMEAASNYFTLVRPGQPCGLESAAASLLAMHHHNHNQGQPNNHHQTAGLCV